MVKRSNADNFNHTPNKKMKPLDLLDDGANSNIPIFLRKTYKMIESCDDSICSWTPDGEMFTVKNPEVFASEIIPQYFDHNKFSSFARQLNFYGFRKIQTKPIRNEDFDKSTVNHVTFFNEKFKRGRHDLLKDIQRSTRGGGAQASLAEQTREMEALRNTVTGLAHRIQAMEQRWQEMTIMLDREIQNKAEMAVLDILSGRQTSLAQITPSLPTSLGEAALVRRAEHSFGAASTGRNITGSWGAPLLGSQAARAFSTASASSLGGRVTSLGALPGVSVPQPILTQPPNVTIGTVNGATLPPHPKQKSLPPAAVGAGGIGGLIQASNQGPLQNGLAPSGNPSLLMRNVWEDKFFKTLMMNDGHSRAASLAGLAATGAGSGQNVAGLAALAAAQQSSFSSGLAALRQASNARATAAQTARDSALTRQTTAEILLAAAGCEVSHPKETVAQMKERYDNNC